MQMNSTLEMFAAAESGFKGRKPGGIKSRNPDQVLQKAQDIWGNEPDFKLELAREMKSECPHTKVTAFADMSPTQRYNVASRMHSKAQTRMRAARLKAKKMKAATPYPNPIQNSGVHAGGPGSGRYPKGSSKNSDRGLSTKELIDKHGYIPDKPHGSYGDYPPKAKEPSGRHPGGGSQQRTPGGTAYTHGYTNVSDVTRPPVHPYGARESTKISHKDSKGNEVIVNTSNARSGSVHTWVHKDANGVTQGKGRGPASLHKYLSNFHKK